MSQGTHSATKGEAQKGRKWWVVDVADLPVGRAASKVATLLKGKHKPSYTPSMDTGDFVVVVNAEKVRFSGKKETGKLYFTHTGHPGGARQTPPNKLRARHPDAIFLNAVERMLPRSALGRDMMRKLKVYAGSEHPHVAQKPEPLKLAL
ncbi:MAG TPA: 50S ribosomal protein L13 [Anaeromyxobacteraceae bacterium]|nr:50S ribosomal protein L13 [Anaeromyxobacteraceae bacterium]